MGRRLEGVGRRALCEALLTLCPYRQTVCAHFRQMPIPEDLGAVRRYLDSALQEKEFKYTCPHSAEILAAYRPAVHPR